MASQGQSKVDRPLAETFQKHNLQGFGLIHHLVELMKPWRHKLFPNLWVSIFFSWWLPPCHKHQIDLKQQQPVKPVPHPPAAVEVVVVNFIPEKVFPNGFITSHGPHPTMLPLVLPSFPHQVIKYNTWYTSSPEQMLTCSRVSYEISPEQLLTCSRVPYEISPEQLLTCSRVPYAISLL